MRGAREVCLAALVVMLMVSWYAVNLDPELSLAANARVRRSVSAAQRRAWAAGRAASDPSAAAVTAEPPSASALSAASAGGAPGPDGCPPGRRPYHVLMTAASGRYQEWQSRIAYYHYLKQKRLHPCSEMGGFTRLVNLPGGQPDRLVHEMPSVVVKQLSSNARKEGGDYGFIVMNRPWGVLQLLATEAWRNIPEEYVLIMETDHLFMRPPANKATPDSPSAFKFYYMNAKDPKLAPIIKNYWSGPLDDVDPVGPSPAIMTKRTLEKLAPAWWDFSLRMKRDDAAANAAFGWVLEMWGYTLGALSVGIRHVVDPDFQCEPQGTGMDGMANYPIYHYTFDLRTERVWSLSKRTYHGRYFPTNYRPPPPCSAESHFALTGLFNEASAALPGWEGENAKGDAQPWPPPARHWRHDHTAAPAPGAPLDAWPSTPPAAAPAGAPAGLVHAAAGTGPWVWGGRVFFILARGVLTSQPAPLSAIKGGTGKSGRWRFADAADEATGGGDGGAAAAAPLLLELCGATYRAAFRLAPGGWSLRAEPVGGEGGAAAGGFTATLDAPPPSGSHAAEAAALAPGSLAAALAGSGPFAWAGMSPAAFLRGGRFQSPWGVGTWAPKAGDSAVVVATFFGIVHELSIGSAECGRLLSVRKSDGDRVPVAFAHEAACELRESGGDGRARAK